MALDRIHRLSLAALRVAASDPTADAAGTAQRLYKFGTLPHAASCDRDFGPDDDPMAVLGLTRGGRARRALEARYAPTTLPGWYSFAQVPATRHVAAACKLYVSPIPAALGQAFPLIVDEFVRAEVRSFKVGRGILGVLRPDKIVAYFEDHAHLRAVARSLAPVLRGCSVQGVPFTSDLAGNGLLSWGIDPQLGASGESWRAWITKRLASSLTAHPGASRDERIAVALADVRRRGVDPDTWIASADTFEARWP